MTNHKDNIVHKEGDSEEDGRGRSEGDGQRKSEESY